MQTYKHRLHNIQHVYSKHSCLIPSSFGRKTAGEAFCLAGHVSLLIFCSYLEILFVWNSRFMQSHVHCVVRER